MSKCVDLIIVMMLINSLHHHFHFTPLLFSLTRTFTSSMSTESTSANDDSSIERRTSSRMLEPIQCYYSYI